MKLITSLARASRPLSKYAAREYSSAASPVTSPFAPRHLLSIADLSPSELNILVKNAFRIKQAAKSGNLAFGNGLVGKTVAVLFSKRSTRTRVSTEAAIASMGGHPLFLGKDDIQLGVNESLYDTSLIISSMTSAIVARVHAHQDVADLAKHSSVPVINALSDLYHPMQILADYLTIYEAFYQKTDAPQNLASTGLGLNGLKIAWVGDANNVMFDLAIGAMKLGVEFAVATPRGYEIPRRMREIIKESSEQSSSLLSESNQPEEAVKDADVIVTDTWVSMGQESEKAKKLNDFAGFQVTAELAERGGANKDWRFMHCMPRHPEEVDDAVFYGPRSLAFPEAENRLWAAISAIQGFVIHKGQIVET